MPVVANILTALRYFVGLYFEFLAPSSGSYGSVNFEIGFPYNFLVQSSTFTSLYHNPEFITSRRSIERFF